jgi:hypothetical protein
VSQGKNSRESRKRGTLIELLPVEQDKTKTPGEKRNREEV